MFKKRAFLIVFSILFVAGLLSVNVFYVSDKNRKSHLKVLEYLQPTTFQNKGTTQRNQVTKNLWMQNKDTLYQYMITSENSILHLNQLKDQETKVVEEMEQATCLLQQKIYYVDKTGKKIEENVLEKGTSFPMQQICRLKVQSGVYTYLAKHFVGDQVQIDIFELPGHELSSTLSFEKGKKVLQGHCDHIDFYFLESKPNLKVQNLVADVFEKEKSL